MIDLSRSRIPPYAHQVVGVDALVKNPFFMLADEMGAGKTKQVIDAACHLFINGTIRKALTLAPAPVRGVWFDPDFGELKKHLWSGLPVKVTEYHAKSRRWVQSVVNGQPYLDWMVTNYDFARVEDYLDELVLWADKQTLLVLDESSAVKNANAKQTKAALRLRQKCGRVVLLNGTPITNSPGDMYAQGRIMHFDILECSNFFQFRARYAKMGGWQGKQIVGWHDVEDIQQRFAPFVLRRLKEDCLDLPEKLPPVVLHRALTPNTWNRYREMRDDMVTWLSQQTVSVAPQAITKVMRLAQITSGFVGGVEAEIEGAEEMEAPPDYLPFEGMVTPVITSPSKPVAPFEFIGREKLDGLLEWVEERIYERPNFKFIVWTRHRPELHRTAEELKGKFPQLTVGLLHGGQKRHERDEVMRLLNPATTVPGPAGAVATLGTGSVGLTLTAADTNYYMSLNTSLLHLLQSRDRTHRPTQVNPVSYYYSVATGPKGQKTIDHQLMKALQSHEDLAKWTTDAWVHALTEE